MSVKAVWLIIRADQTVRVNARYPARLRWDDLAIKINLRFPDTWGRVSPTPISIDVPDFAPEVTVPETPALQGVEEEAEVSSR